MEKAEGVLQRRLINSNKIIVHMGFLYFKGPREDMGDLLDDEHVCSFCGQISEMCFSVEYAITDVFGEGEKDDKVGCVDCLRKGSFEFWHDTEYGMLDENGLTKIYSHNMDNPPPIAEETLRELRRTPQILTWQKELWLTHCNDFMVYKGTWEPKDFYKNSVTGNGRDLFLAMTDAESNHLWDESLAEGKDELDEWYATYYAFECRHCGKLRGNWDCD
ncbi:CbrC family protein [Pontibacter sp. H249]|uniref:CbrC family protein n=1 Tax=Pontibacter sp. H249 TaxID=3133420 RepID=UPI0030BDC8A5